MRKKELFYFVAVLTLASILLNYVTAMDLSSQQVSVASQTSALLRLEGINAQSYGTNLVNYGGITLVIVNECVGWMGIFAVTALILAYPGVSWKKRAKGILVAVPTLYAVNLMRLVTTFSAGYYFGSGALYFTHDLLWRTVLIIFALLFWSAWIYFSVEGKSFSDFRKSPRSQAF